MLNFNYGMFIVHSDFGTNYRRMFRIVFLVISVPLSTISGVPLLQYMFVNLMLRRWVKSKMFLMKFSMYLSSIGWYSVFLQYTSTRYDFTSNHINLSIVFALVNSVRKRQSVVCRYSDGRLILYCKVIF